MSEIAVTLGTFNLYWSSIIILLGILAWFCLSCALYTANGGKAAAMWVLFPLAVLFSVLLSRGIHWYCHMEQYGSLLSALTDYSSGSFVLPGMLLGVWLAATLVKLLGYCTSVRALLDALTPGVTLAIAFIRLSALFNNSCRSKIVIKSPSLQHLPLGAAFTTSSGTEYRFATFFVEFLLLLLLTVWLLRFYHSREEHVMKGGCSEDGHTVMMFLVFYGVIEFVLDSTRYDKSFFPFCGFVSFVQIFIAVSIFAVFVYYSVVSVKVNRRKPIHWILWVGFGLTLALTGFLEYWVQRHGDLYLSCYAGMTASIACMAFTVYKMYLTCLEPQED